MSHTYKVVGAPLGQGAVGTVFAVENERLEPFALKLFAPSVVSDDKRKRFDNEMGFLARTNHTNITPLIDRNFIVEENKKLPFYVMPRYATTLRSLIKNGIPPDKVLPYFGDLLDGVESLHLKGVWHRDLKPENILYDENADSLLIADLGAAFFAEEEMQTAVETKATTRLANFRYAAPEQREKNRIVNHLADIFALGLLLNEMFTAEVLQGLGHRKIEEIAPKFAYLDPIVESMAQQNPTNRIQSIELLKHELIGRKASFIELQKLNENKDTVIKTSELNDPLIDDPPRIIDVKYESGALIVSLNKSVTREWASNFGNPHFSYEWIFGKNPSQIQINGDKLLLPCRENQVLSLGNYLKLYLLEAIKQYESRTESEHKVREAERRKTIENQMRQRQKEMELTETLQKNLIS